MPGGVQADRDERLFGATEKNRGPWRFAAHLGVDEAPVVSGIRRLRRGRRQWTRTQPQGDGGEKDPTGAARRGVEWQHLQADHDERREPARLADYTYRVGRDEPTSPACADRSVRRAARTFAAGNDVVIGRDLRADVRIAHPLISRAHLVLRFDQGRWIAIDNGSLNGMYVNGRRVPTVDIQDGHRLDIGNPDGPQLTFEVAGNRTAAGRRPRRSPSPAARAEPGPLSSRRRRHPRPPALSRTRPVTAGLPVDPAAAYPSAPQPSYTGSQPHHTRPPSAVRSRVLAGRFPNRPWSR